jgi:hypothetical protein
MKERLTQVVVLSVSLMLLSAILPVNSSYAAVPVKVSMARTDGVPLPPPTHIWVSPTANGTFVDGVPLPPPTHIWASPGPSSPSVDGVLLPPPTHIWGF